MTTETAAPAVGQTGTATEAPMAEPAGTTATRETLPKANKRGSIFGNFFNKKDATSPTVGTEAAPAVPAKDDETAVTSPTVPQLEDPVKPTPAPVATGTTNEITSPANEPATAPTTSPTSPETGKPSRRSSFFNNLGTKKEKRSDAVSDAEGTDGEGKKSTGSKLGGLFRKPSRATPTSSTKPEHSATAATETTDGPAPISKEAPAATNGDGVPESIVTIESQQTPVQASA